MKDIFKIIVMSFVLAFDIMIVSCTTEIVDPRSESTIERDVNGNYIFNAQLNDLDLTKTFRKEDGSIYWDQNETIKVFYNSQKYGTFTSTNQSASLTASFSGNFNSPVSDSEITQNGIVALYPSENAEYNSNKVLLTVSEEQEAEVGTFKKGLFPSIAQSKSSSLSFYNICGGIKLSVHNEGIKAITLRGNNSETLAGRISVSFSSTGIPEYSVVDGVSEIKLTAPDGGYFQVGKFYYIVSLPCTLLNGFTIIYHTDNDDATVKFNDTVVIHRSKFGLVLDKDVHGFVVRFADASFKACVVDQYDDNIDGEIDFIEAENVTNINCANRGVASLQGIEYFKNLKSLNCSGNSIKEINLSSLSKLTTLNCYNNPLESLVLDGCSALTSMSIINGTTNSISNKKVSIDGYQGAAKFKFSSNGAGFTDFSFANSSSVKTFEIFGDFTKSLNIYNVPGLSELQVGDINVEVMDLHNLNLSSIDLTKNTNLKELYLNNNKLTSINLSKCTQLVKLNLSDNKLQSINVRMNTLLEELKINNNSSISTLNIDNNTDLQVLEAEGLSISTLDMSQHSSLIDVKLRNNHKLQSMIIWQAATKTNDYLLFDMANVAVTDANGASYGCPYSIGQIIPWFNGGIIYSLNDNGGGMLLNLKNLTPTYYEDRKWWDSSFYWWPMISSPWVPELFWNNSSTDGEQNMKDVYSYYGNYDKFAAYDTCQRYSKDGMWYVPSINELEDLLTRTHTGTVYQILYNLNSAKGRIEHNFGYWSSTIGQKGLVSVGTWINKNSMNEFRQTKYGDTSYSNGGASYVRGIRKF